MTEKARKEWSCWLPAKIAVSPTTFGRLAFALFRASFCLFVFSFFGVHDQCSDRDESRSQLIADPLLQASLSVSNLGQNLGTRKRSVAPKE